jgi:hypothetical protein
MEQQFSKIINIQNTESTQPEKDDGGRNGDESREKKRA